MKFFIYISLLLISQLLSGQKYAYNVYLEAIEIENLGGIHSYSYGQYDGEWLIVGGRLDGLHQRQPFAAFDPASNNNQLIVVNPATEEVWKAPLDNLSMNLKEQLSSTNMQFFQDDDLLILTGGYAFSPSSSDHKTFPFITITNIKDLIKEVKENNVRQSSFLQKSDPKFAVTGGRLGKIDDIFYLVGGHRFDGRYNPMGPNHDPGFVQEYTDEIRSFTLEFLNNDFSVKHLLSIHDEMHLHRRDYNLLPQIRNGQEELMLFSGVFQNNADVPWLYPVSITSGSYEAHQSFNQHYNHYHCAALPIYNESEEEMHNIFFGGIAQFYEEDGIMVQDNDVPFVNTIADVVRMTDGQFVEDVLHTEMPGLLGAGSEFILMRDNDIFYNEVLNGDMIESTPTAIGYVFGGIRSTLPNIFFINNGSQSEAMQTIYKVSISKDFSSTTTELPDSENGLLIYPNPAQDFVRMAIDLENSEDINVIVYDSLGNKVGAQSIPAGELSLGRNYLVLDQLNVGFGAFVYHISFGNQNIIRKVVWSE